MTRSSSVEMESKFLAVLFLFAASIGDKENCEDLIKRGVDVNSAMEDGTTALMFAVVLNRVEMVKMLLEQEKINVGAAKKSGETALSIATIFCNKEIMALLRSRLEIEQEIESENRGAKRERESAPEEVLESWFRKDEARFHASIDVNKEVDFSAISIQVDEKSPFTESTPGRSPEAYEAALSSKAKRSESRMPRSLKNPQHSSESSSKSNSESKGR